MVGEEELEKMRGCCMAALDGVTCPPESKKNAYRQSRKMHTDMSRKMRKDSLEKCVQIAQKNVYRQSRKMHIASLEKCAFIVQKNAYIQIVQIIINQSIICLIKAWNRNNPAWNRKVCIFQYKTAIIFFLPRI